MQILYILSYSACKYFIIYFASIQLFTSALIRHITAKNCSTIENVIVPKITNNYLWISVEKFKINFLNNSLTIKNNRFVFLKKQAIIVYSTLKVLNNIITKSKGSVKIVPGINKNYVKNKQVDAFITKPIINDCKVETSADNFEKIILNIVKNSVNLCQYNFIMKNCSLHNYNSLSGRSYIIYNINSMFVPIHNSITANKSNQFTFFKHRIPYLTLNKCNEITLRNLGLCSNCNLKYTIT